nr:hypothetical protein BaRGS_003728 [Batillaria attramentaria]
MCTMLSACALLFSVAGGQSFTAKYIENQFSLTAWRTNLSMAATLLGTACLGTFFGGYVSKRFKMGAVSSLKFIVVMQILSVVATSLGLAFKCEQPNIHNSPGPRAIFEEAMSGCYDGCACDDDDYFPICDGDGRTFFSPCHAGCSGNIGNDYVNCTCIPGSKASAGMCDYSCFMFYPFIASVCASTLFGTLSIIPKLVVYIREL